VHDALPGGVVDEPLLALANRDFYQAVEVICSMALEHPGAGLESSVANFAIATQDFAAANPEPPPWLANTRGFGRD
jgi:hypothetical protein